MWTTFFWENAHFAANFFAALVFFAMFWLYFDAWLERKVAHEIPKLAGILLLAISFVIHATTVESTLLQSTVDASWIATAYLITKTMGYLLLIAGVILDPLQPAPQTRGLSRVVVLSPLVPVSFPILSAFVTWIYLRRATVGLERHLRTVTVSFFILTLAEVLAQADLFTQTTSVSLYQMVAPFGWLWILQHLVLLIGVGLLGSWVWQYLTKRLQPQLFMIFTASILAIFLLTTVIFTGQLLRNMQQETLARLETDVKVLHYGIDAKKSQIVSKTQSLAVRSDIIDATIANDKQRLATLIAESIAGNNLGSLVLVNADGAVLARGEDRERVGDSLSSDPLFLRAQTGVESVSVHVAPGAVAPEVWIRAVTPIVSEKKVVGAVMAGIPIDNTFVDGIKAATGLEAGIYGHDVLAATTQLSIDKKSRWIGTKLTQPAIVRAVLERGEHYSGSSTILNTPYFVSFQPLQDSDGVTVGMLFVGRPQEYVLATASRSIEITFVVTAMLIVLAIIPSFFISRFIANQLS